MDTGNDIETQIARARGQYEKAGVTYVGHKTHTYRRELGPVAIFKKGDEYIYVALNTLRTLRPDEIAASH